MSSEDLYAKLRIECYNKSYDCFGNSYIFNKRAKKFNRWVTFLKAFGVLVPATVGITALGYGYDNHTLEKLIVIAIPLTIIQFLFSLWAIIYKWDDELSYAFEAIQSYNSLYKRYYQLASYPPDTFEKLKQESDLIGIESSFREQQDAAHGIKEWEERMGMRFSLREHKVACYGCKNIPLDMKSTDCPVCGKFAYKI